MERWFRRGGELADEGGPAEAEALALLRAAVAAGHGPARVRLAAFLTCQYSDADAASHAEALRLLGDAVASDVPGARNLLGVTLWDDGAVDDAEGVLRAAVAEGDLDAPVNLAGLLHSKGADAETTLKAPCDQRSLAFGLCGKLTVHCRLSGRSPRAPTATARMPASSSSAYRSTSNVVSTMIRERPPAATMRRVASIPSTPGTEPEAR